MNRRTRIGLLIPTLFLGTAAVAGENPVRKPPESSQGAPALSAAEAVASGRSLYAHYCSHCHGFNMVNPGNISYDLRTFPHDDKERFVNSVTNGKNGRMPPWKGVISPEELDQIWAYVLTGGKP